MTGGEPLPGGAVERGVQRIGMTVQRPRSGRFTHKVLQHCAREGFDGVPRLLRVAGDHEWLSYIPGETHHSWRLFNETELVHAAQLLRSFHETMRSFPGLPVGQTVVHGDISASNMIWQAGVPAVLIDLDYAHHGDILEDLVSLAWAFCISSSEWNGQQDIHEQARRCGLLASAYGLASVDRARATDMLLVRIGGAVNRAQTNHRSDPTTATRDACEGLTGEYNFVLTHQTLIQCGWNSAYPA
jgi:hypothetical protein